MKLLACSCGLETVSLKPVGLKPVGLKPVSLKSVGLKPWPMVPLCGLPKDVIFSAGPGALSGSVLTIAR